MKIIYDFKLEDSEFGTIYVNLKRSAKHVIIRVINGNLFVVAPSLSTESMVKQTIDKSRSEIRQLILRNETKQSGKRLIDRNFAIQAGKLHFSIECNRKSDFRVYYNPLFYDPLHESALCTRGLMKDLESYSIVLDCPQDIDFHDANRQQWLESVIVKSIQNFAHPYLSFLLSEMSHLSGLQIESESFGHAQTRWGACRADRTLRKGQMSRVGAVVDVGQFTKEEYLPHKIMLSAYTALLPEHLTKYVILHELSHTRHPDHSADFHATVNSLTQAILGMSEQECEKQMKAYHTNIFSFASKKSEP